MGDFGISADVGGVLGAVRGSKGLGMAKRGQKWTQANMRLGNQLDMENQKAMFDYRIDQGLQHGMTPYEMFMGPAAGAGGGTTGSGQVLGNSASALTQQMMQTKADNRKFNMQLVTDLYKTKMQTDTQKEVAGIQAGTTERGQDLKYAVESGQLKLNQQTYNSVTLPKAAAELKINEQQLKIKINEVVTSSAKYQKAMKIMTMGVDNSTNLALQNMLGIDITDQEKMSKLSDNKKAQILGMFLAYSSTTFKELTATENYLGKFNPAPGLGNSIGEAVGQNLYGAGNAIGKNIAEFVRWLGSKKIK
jgi:hypothetical protein